VNVAKEFRYQSGICTVTTKDNVIGWSETNGQQMLHNYAQLTQYAFCYNKL